MMIGPVLLWVLWFFMLLLTDLLPLPRYLQVLLKLVQAVAIFIDTLINELCLKQDDKDNEDDICGGNQLIFGGRSRVIPRNRPAPRVAYGTTSHILLQDQELYSIIDTSTEMHAYLLQH